MNNTKLIIVVPCYNEEEVLQETTRQLSTVLSGMEQEGKITEGKLLYVDDGSRDATWHIIEQLSTENLRVMGLKLAHNVGHQQALWAGLEWAANAPFDAIVSIDADLQDDVQAIVEMTERFNEGTDIVYGVRKERKTDTFFKKHTAQAFYKLMQTMGGDVVYNHADFRLMSKRALQALVAHPERNLFLRGIVRSLGYPSDFVYYDRHERFAGESKYPLSKMLNFAIDGITSFSVKPLRLITTFGLLFMLVAIAIIGYDKEKLEAFRKLMVNAFRDSRNGTVRDFVIKCGYDKEEAFQFTDGRDTFIDIDDEINQKENVYYFYFQTESAWSPNVEVFTKIIREKFDDEFELEHCSEESGMGIYINTDSDGLFFPDRYYLDCCINNEYYTEYYKTKEAVLDWIKEKFPTVDVTVNTALHKIEDAVEKCLGDDEDGYISLHEFSYD